MKPNLMTAREQETADSATSARLTILKGAGGKVTQTYPWPLTSDAQKDIEELCTLHKRGGLLYAVAGDRDALVGTFVPATGWKWIPRA
jgi:hypothetical protein